MNAEELREFRTRTRRFAIASGCAIVGFGVVNLLGFLWNRLTIEHLDEQVKTCVEACQVPR